MFISSSWGQLLWHNGAPWCRHTAVKKRKKQRSETWWLNWQHVPQQTNCAARYWRYCMTVITVLLWVYMQGIKFKLWFNFPQEKRTRKKRKVLTKRERRKAGEDMETVSCKRKIMDIRAATQTCTESPKRKQNNARKDTTHIVFSTRKGWNELEEKYYKEHTS